MNDSRQFRLVPYAIAAVWAGGLIAALAWPLWGDLSAWMKDPAGPAWVQAVGSVIAIFVAVIVPLRLQRQARLEKEAEARAKARSLAVDLIDEITDLAASMQALQADGYRTLGDAYGYDSALRRTSIPDGLKQSVKQLHELGPAGTSLQLALLELSFLRGKLMECGLKSEGTRNNLAVGEAKHSLDEAVALLHKASKQLGALFDDD